MSNIINIEANLPHAISEVICLKCLHRWISVRPIETRLKNIECPNCGHGYVIETGQSMEEICN